MTTTQTNVPDEFTQAMQSSAESFVESSQQILNLSYDYSPQSLQMLDQSLAVFHPEGFVFDSGWHSHAAYAGEVVRRALGGKWVQEADGSGASLRGVGGKATIYPFLWLSKRIDAVKSGTDESAVALKYQKLLQVLNREDETPDMLPSDYVRKLAESMDADTQSGSQLSSDAQESASSKSGPSDDGDGDEALETALKMAPTICFFMIAAADGNIDKKEAKSFLAAVMKYATHENPLIREVFGSTPSRFADYCNAISESAPLAVLKLALCKIAAQKASPEHAAEFCRALWDMSTTIASSSGGLFSRGKVSKHEQEVLDVIALTLGLKDA